MLTFLTHARIIHIRWPHWPALPAKRVSAKGFKINPKKVLTEKRGRGNINELSPRATDVL